MDLRPSEEQQQLVDAFGALYAKESPPERVRDAEPSGFDQRLWDHLFELGSVAMAVDEMHGGWGASVLDLALVAQEHGRALGSAPLIETQVAARLLARTGDEGAAALSGALEGERLVTVSLRRAQGEVAGLVPAGAIATDALVRRGDELLLVPLGGDRVAPENVGAMPLADVQLSGGKVVARGAEAEAAVEAALDDWLVLMANALVGISQRSLEIGVEYTSEREAFDQKIGGFQAVGHRLADCKAATDGAELLAHEAAWAAQEDPDSSLGARNDGLRLRIADREGHQLLGPALPRRLRVHAGVRHPALLPACEGLGERADGYRTCLSAAR